MAHKGASQPPETYQKIQIQQGCIPADADYKLSRPHNATNYRRLVRCRLFLCLSAGIKPLAAGANGRCNIVKSGRTLSIYVAERLIIWYCIGMINAVPQRKIELSPKRRPADCF